MSHHQPQLVIIAEGYLLVTGEGEIVIDEVLPRHRALMVTPETFISIDFDPCEPPPPPCAGTGEEDEIDWELFFKKHDHKTKHRCRRHGESHDHSLCANPEGDDFKEELRLKIFWSVNSARTIKWLVKVPR